MWRKPLAIVLSVLLIRAEGPRAYGVEKGRPTLRQLVDKPYLELLETAPALKFSEKEISDLKRQLEKEKDSEADRLKREEEQLKDEAKQIRKQLEDLNKRSSRDSEEMSGRRRDLHCTILRLEREMRRKKAQREHGLPVAQDNRLAKLDLIQQWPARRQEIRRTIESGRARGRRFGNVEDIGFRSVGEGQEKDIKAGEDAIREMKAYGLIPPELENKEIKDYVQKLADKIAASSDLKVPIKTTVLDSDEINAFALPGGFLYVNTGLLEKAETESELAGVLAHESAHVAARHGNRLMKRANIANIIFQGAQIAAAIFTGGVVGLGTYYALQYGFYGLGMVLNLALLGVSREFEVEADQLGVQYTWKAGFAPSGFITFFDKMASEKGYVKSASFFRTHPPFFDRIVVAFSEMEYLPQKKDLRVDSTEFQKMKAQLKKVLDETKQEKKQRPTLMRKADCPEAYDESEPFK